MRLLYAEVLKVRTAPRTPLGLVLGLVALAVLGSGSTASGGNDSSLTPGGDQLVTWDVIGVATIAAVFTLILGILIVTWEYRHGTITQTFLASPRRERVIGAKLAVAFVAGGLLTALAIVVALAFSLIWISPELTRDHWELIGRLVFAGGAWGVLGAGLGAVVQSQVGAIVTSFVWFLVAEPLIGLRFDHFADYLPGNVIDRLSQHGSGLGVDELNPTYSFGLWTAALLAAAYAAGLGALGTASALWRDIT